MAEVFILDGESQLSSLRSGRPGSRERPEAGGLSRRRASAKDSAGARVSRLAHDTKVQNTTLKGIQTALLYITALVAQNVLTFQKHTPNLVLIFLLLFTTACHIQNVYICMTHSCIFLHKIKIHPWQNEHGMKGRWGTYPLPEGCWHILEDRIMQTEGEEPTGCVHPNRTHQPFCFNAAPSFQLGFLTIPVISLHFVYSS